MGNSMAEPAFVSAAERRDIRRVAQVHEEAFPRFFMTTLGPRFLCEYYALVADSSDAIFLKAARGGLTVGFVAGFLRPADFYRRLRARRFRLAFAVARSVLVKPWLLPRLALSYGRAGDRAKSCLEDKECELASLAVDPGEAGRGTGTLLVNEFVKQAKEAGARRVVLTTDAKNNERAIGFYERLGFAVRSGLRPTPTRAMFEMVLELGALK